MQKILKISSASENWVKNTRQIDAKHKKKTCIVMQRFKKFALPMQIGKKKLVKSMQKI